MRYFKHKLFRLVFIFSLAFIISDLSISFAFEVHNEIVGLEGHHRWRHRWNYDDGDGYDFYKPFPPIYNDRLSRPYRFNQSYYPECGYVWQNDRYVSPCEE